ncbi:MAG TPA: hypothetical protein DCX89_01865 [Saprospirales bacterium]|nr:hypothetical protein [Saprospirales bacterium]HRQ31109.1 DUF4230 domain-containing protein [Saprospiraceae bacterium]
MKKFSNYLIFIIILVLLLGMVWYWGYRSSLSKNQVTVSSDILLESVKNVMKLGTIEGNFVEFYRYENIKHLDISMFRKKAFIRVKAKVLVGFNLDSLEIKIDHPAKKITIGSIPAAEILSVDHSLYYFDIDEGVFNSFNRNDYNMFQKVTKEKIKKKAKGSDLIMKAETELKQHLKVYAKIFEEAGWKLEFIYEMPDKIAG